MPIPRLFRIGGRKPRKPLPDQQQQFQQQQPEHVVIDAATDSIMPDAPIVPDVLAMPAMPAMPTVPALPAGPVPSTDPASAQVTSRAAKDTTVNTADVAKKVSGYKEHPANQKTATSARKTPTTTDAFQENPNKTPAGDQATDNIQTTAPQVEWAALL